MPRKLKFKPIITRIKLNPEQAVLMCQCSNGTYTSLGLPIHMSGGRTVVCCNIDDGTRSFTLWYCDGGVGANRHGVAGDTGSS